MADGQPEPEEHPVIEVEGSECDSDWKPAPVEDLAEQIEEMIVSPPEPDPVVERPTLKLHQPEPPKKVHAVFDDIEFDDDLIAKMIANMAANGMTLADLAG